MFQNVQSNLLAIILGEKWRCQLIFGIFARSRRIVSCTSKITSNETFYTNISLQNSCEIATMDLYRLLSLYILLAQKIGYVNSSHLLRGSVQNERELLIFNRMRSIPNDIWRDVDASVSASGKETTKRNDDAILSSKNKNELTASLTCDINVFLC
jgi:hypothetical protein